MRPLCNFGVTDFTNWKINNISSADDIVAAYDSDFAGPQDRQTLLAGAAGSVGAAGVPGQSEILNAITDFLVDRAKSEFDQYIVEKFVAAICNADLGPVLIRLSHTDSARIDSLRHIQKSPQLARLFPSSCNLLAPVATHADEPVLPGMTAVRAALNRDAGGLPSSIIHLLLDPTVIKSTTVRDRAVTGAIVLYFANALTTKQDFTATLAAAHDSLESYSRSFALGTLSSDAYPLLRNMMVAAALSETILPFGPKSIPSAGNSSVGPDSAAYFALEALVVNVCDSASFSAAAIGWGPKCTDTVISTQARAYWSSSHVRAVIAAAQGAQSLFPVDKNNMGGAVASAIAPFLVPIADAELSNADAGGVSDALARLGRIPAYASAHDYSAIVLDVAAVVTAFSETRQALPPDLVRTITFAIDMSEAQDAATMKAAMEKFVAPSGAFARKRTSLADNFVYAELNAYAGGAIGAELTAGSWGAAAAPYLPVGLEVGLSGPHVALFLPMIDLGQLAAWRLTNESKVNGAPQEKVRDVFSPGAYLMIGITRTIPVTIGFGASYAPHFRTINATTGTLSPAGNTFRFNWITALDVPLFP